MKKNCSLYPIPSCPTSFNIVGRRDTSLSFLILWTKQEQLPTDMVNIPATAGKDWINQTCRTWSLKKIFLISAPSRRAKKVTHDFKFKNVWRKEPCHRKCLCDCGCTVAEVPKQSIPPGEGNRIRVTFDSEGKAGIVTKSVTVVTNCIPNKSVSR